MPFERALLAPSTEMTEAGAPRTQAQIGRPRSLSFRLLIAAALWLPVGALALWSGSTAQGLFGRVAGPLFLAIFSLTAPGVGRPIRHRLVPGEFGALESLCLDLAVGWGLLGAGLTVLAACHLLTPAVVVPAAVVMSVMCGLGIGASHSGWAAWGQVPWRRLAGIAVRRKEARIPMVLVGLLCADTFLWAAGPVWDWDSEMYHLPCTRFLVEHRGLAVSTFDPLMNIPGQMYVCYAPGLFQEQATAFPALLMWEATVLTSLLAAAFAARRIGVNVAIWTVPTFWSGAIVTAVAITPRVEPFCALMFLATIVLLDHALRSHGKLRFGPFLLSGLCIGAAGASKYQALYGWVIVAGWLGWLWVSQQRLRNARSLIAGALLFAVAILVNAPWWGKNLQAFGNPFYPALAHGDSSSLTHAQSFETARPAGLFPFLQMTANVFLTPNAFNGAPNHFPHYLFLLFPLVLLTRPPRAVSWLAGISVAYYILSMALTPVTRYLFPIFGTLSICTAYVMVYVSARMQMRILFPGVAALSIAFALLIPARTFTTPALLGYFAGVLDEGSFLAQMSGSGFHESTTWINDNTPKDAVVLLCWDARQFRIRRSTIIDPAYATWAALFSQGRSSPAEVFEFLNSNDIDYVLVNEGALAFNVLKSKRISEQAQQEFERQRNLLVGRVLDPVLESRSVTVYKVRKPEQPSAHAAQVSHGG
jgi:hypothetical protein